MNQTAKIGAFFLIVLAVCAAIMLRIEDIRLRDDQRNRQEIEIRFKDVAGLDRQSAVRMAGVPVGKVTKIDLLPEGRALVTLSLDKDVQLREGAYGDIKSLGMLGDKYIELFPGSLQSSRLNPGARLEGASSPGFDDLSRLASDVGKDVKEVTAALRGSLGGKEGEDKINRIVENVGLLAEEMRALVQANRANVDVTVANLKMFSEEMRETLARVDRILDENRTGVKSTVSNAEELTQKLQTAADNLNSVTGKLDSGQGTLGKLINEDSVHGNINEALESVKKGVESLTNTIGKINETKIELGFQGQYNARQSEGKASFSIDVNPDRQRFYHIELGALPDGKRVDETYILTTTLPNGEVQTTRTVVERTEDKFVMGAQIGFRLNKTALRVGLIESRGGVAIDHALLKDRLVLTGEAWDFGRKNGGTQLKLMGKWNTGSSFLTPTSNIYVTGGLEDALNKDRRSVFVGAGVKWTDEDIRTLLGIGAASLIGK